MKILNTILAVITVSALTGLGAYAYDPVTPISKGGTNTSTNKFLLANPVSGATAEYPLSEGTGTVVNDITGNGNTANFAASTAAPSWTTYGVAFNSLNATQVNKYIQTPVKTWRTLILNTCAMNYPVGSGSLLVLPTRPALAGTTGEGLFIFGAKGFYTTQQTTGSTLFPGIIDSSTTHPTTVTSPTQLCNNLAFTLDATDHVYINGVEPVYSAQATNSSRVTVTGNGYALGSAGSGATSSLFFAGYINYAIFYPTVLTAAEVSQVGKYIDQQVTKRQGYPSANINYSTSQTSQIICGGDSITVGATTGANPWCNATYTTPLTNTYAFATYAFGGDSAQEELSVFPARAYPLFAPNVQKNYCQVFLGTNDIGGAVAESAAVTWANIQYQGLKLKQQGCIPIVVTMLSRGATAGATGADPAKNTLNGLIRANWSNVFSALNDYAAIPELGADGAYANTACFATDQLHPNNNGSCRGGVGADANMGLQLAKVVNILDGATLDNPVSTTSNAYVQAIGDNVVVQDPTLAATNQLPDCTGLTGLKRTIINADAVLNVTATTTNSQTITGSAIVLPSTTGVFVCNLISAAAAGNYWVRTQ